MKREQYPIDFVVTWLDSSDPVWIKEYQKYKGITPMGDQTAARFRDWGLFKYWFRAVENYAPWVNKVYLVTNGTFPKWVNTSNSKLVLVRHSDYIPENFLPTFNSCTIELYLNRIPGLSEHFVYFNDDFYINAPITPDYYFKNGLPCDSNRETFYNVPKYNPTDRFSIYMSMLADIGVINRDFDRKKTWRQSPKRWFGTHLGMGIITSLLLYNKERFIGFNWKHNEQPFLKSIFDEAWEKEKDMLEKSCTRFREEVTLNPYFFRYWQFATNRFHPVKLNRIMKYRTVKQDIPSILKALDEQEYCSLCINDTPSCTEEDLVQFKEVIHSAFKVKLPNKSSFEL